MRILPLIACLCLLLTSCGSPAERPASADDAGAATPTPAPYNPLSSPMIEEMAEEFAVKFGNGPGMDVVIEPRPGEKIYLRFEESFLKRFPDVALDLGVGGTEVEFNRPTYINFLNKLHDYIHDLEESDHHH